MKIKSGFKLRNICGEHVIIAEGKENIDFNKIISLNESAAFLWENLIGKEFSTKDIVSLLTDMYDVDKRTAENDAIALIKQWIEIKIIE